jgi:fatty-acyl-CoA synthase
MTSGWNFADVWEAVAERFPEAPALRHGPRHVSWRELDRRADGVAASLLDAGLARQDKVALYLRNRPEYLESLFATFKAGLVPVNTNYRYGDDELACLWDRSETAAVVFDAEFTDVCLRLRPALPAVRRWLRVGDEADCPAWATPYEPAAAAPTARMIAGWGRSGDDLCLLYTDSPTGLPNGVMWRQDDMFRMLESLRGGPAQGGADSQKWVERLERPDPPALPAPPLMHSAAFWFVLPTLNRGGTVVTLTSPTFDAAELLATVVATDVRRLCIVGDAFAKPVLGEIDADPARWDLSKVRLIFSSCAMLSQDSKARLLEHAPRALIVDALASSEAGSVAMTSTAKGETAATARFTLSPNTRVVDALGRDVVPGSGQAGRLAVGGYLPLGYYCDPDKTAATFVVLDGRRHVIAGDWAEVDAEGAITLLGRGSSCIHTGGEQVFPEEVEEVLKQAAGVHDVAVVGVPDERFGEAIVALVEPDLGVRLDEADLIAHVKQRLASYKVPRRVFEVASLGRGPNGKLDHRRLTDHARELVRA